MTGPQIVADFMAALATLQPPHVVTLQDITWLRGLVAAMEAPPTSVPSSVLAALYAKLLALEAKLNAQAQITQPDLDELSALGQAISDAIDAQQHQGGGDDEPLGG